MRCRVFASPSSESCINVDLICLWHQAMPLGEVKLVDDSYFPCSLSRVEFSRQLGARKQRYFLVGNKLDTAILKRSPDGALL